MFKNERKLWCLRLEVAELAGVQWAQYSRRRTLVEKSGRLSNMLPRAIKAEQCALTRSNTMSKEHGYSGGWSSKHRKDTVNTLYINLHSDVVDTFLSFFVWRHFNWTFSDKSDWLVFSVASVTGMTDIQLVEFRCIWSDSQTFPEAHIWGYQNAHHCVFKLHSFPAH